MRYCPSCGSRFTHDARYCPVDGQPTSELPDEAPKAADPLLGTVVDGRYRIERALGEGGMGIVYLATHVALQKRFALKVLRGEMARDHDVVQRFIQEAQASSSIGHANIIDISDFGRLPDGTFYFVMEFLDGESLTDLIARSGGLTPEQAVPIIEMMASALAAAHERGIVHRDLKPDNVFLVRRGSTQNFVKILDFGIAKVGGAASKLTRTGMIFGTPHYMSPEQAAGQAVDKRTDIYALGVIMYEMVTGKVPFDADTFMGILSKHMFEPPRPPTEMSDRQDLGALEPLILKALVKKPEQRYQAMEELLRDIAMLKSGARVSGPVNTVAPVPVNLGPALERTGVPMATTAGLLSFASKHRALVGGSVLVGLGVLVGAGLYVAHVFDTPSTSAEAVAVRAPMPFNLPGLAPQPSAQGAAAVPVGAAPPVRGPTIRLETEPIGAAVYAGDAIVGETPVEVPRPPSGTASYELRLADHRTTTLVVRADSESPVFVALAHTGPTPPSRATVTASVRSTDRPRAPAAARTGSDTPAPPTAMTTSAPPRQAISDVLDPWQ